MVASLVLALSGGGVIVGSGPRRFLSGTAGKEPVFVYILTIDT